MEKMNNRLLPDFEKPPVVEVAVMVQFDAPTLGIPQIMQWWCQIQSQFPGLEQAPPIQTVLESFETKIPKPNVQFQVFDTPPVPRIFMKKANETELIQIQQDRIGYSWRKLKKEDDYPRYYVLRDNFEAQLRSFERFVEQNKLESINPKLCEVTYVNHVFGTTVWHGHNELHKVIPSLTPKLSEGFLTQPEDMQLASRYIIEDENSRRIGRLHIDIEPRFLIKTMEPIYLIRLTARCVPQGKGIEEIFKMLDIGHEWIVRGFTSLTSAEMHKEWGRKR
jgi:uncharacterized protein (TIGR04255 family)